MSGNSSAGGALTNLPSSGDVVEWVKGTLLTDYERRLPPELFARVLARYRGLLLKTLGRPGPGTR